VKARRAIGAAVLIVGGVAVWPHFAVRQDPTVDEIFRTLRPIARVSLSRLAAERAVIVEGRVPSEPPWPRVVARLGPPDFAVVPITSAEDRNRRTYSPEEVPVQLRVEVAGGAADVRVPDRFPYG
jgi:hypothetical protein